MLALILCNVYPALWPALWRELHNLATEHSFRDSVSEPWGIAPLDTRLYDELRSWLANWF